MKKKETKSKKRKNHLEVNGKKIRFKSPDSSVYKNVKAREAFKPHACVQLLLQLSLSLSCSSIGNTWHALQKHALKSFFSGASMGERVIAAPCLL